MKRVLLSALAALFLALSLTACSGDETRDWKYIEKNGELKIGITYFEPMNYLDESGNLKGFETEFAEAVCDIIGVKPVFQEINWKSKETELNAKSIDVIWNGMTINPDLQKNLSISTPYMSNKQILVMEAENVSKYGSSVDDAKIVAEAGSAGNSVCETEEFFSKAKLTEVDTQAKALLEVASGTADACVIDYVMSIGMIGEGTSYATLNAVESRAFGEEEYGIAMRKDDVELTKKINEAIQTLAENGKIKEIATKYKLENLLLI